MLGFEKTYTFPFSSDIPNYLGVFLKKTSLIKRWTKYMKRHIYITLRWQKTLEVYQILPEHRNILWINISASSLGDSLMDLSSRVMLEGKKVDLFSDIKNVGLYKSDSLFCAVFSDTDEARKKKYDLIIIDSFSSRSIKVKADIAPSVPFVGMFGYYNGSEVNRVLFSFHRMNHLLGLVKCDTEINKGQDNFRGSFLKIASKIL